jgi:small subunit ribosomal protein S2
MNDDTQIIENPLIDAERYLKAGAHIGTKMKSGEMRTFIYKERKDGLKVLDVQTLNDRIKYIATLLAKHDARHIVVVSRKLYGQKPAALFAEMIGAKMFTGRFVPGTFTNPQSKEFIEPHIVITVESDSDLQAIQEAAVVKAPVISLASTNNTLRGVDIALPINNKGRKSLALAFWLLSREVLKARGDISKDEEFTKTIEDFEYKLKASDKEKRESFNKRGPRSFSRRPPSRY